MRDETEDVQRGRHITMTSAHLAFRTKLTIVIEVEEYG